MSNNYTQLCAYTEVFTKEEAEYINELWTSIVFDDFKEETELFHDYNNLKELFKDDIDEWQGIIIELDRDSSLCYKIEESGNIEWLSKFLQYFLQKYHKKDIIKFEYSYTCSRMMPDQFGGGAVRISKNNIFYLHTSDIEDYYQLSIDRG